MSKENLLSNKFSFRELTIVLQELFCNEDIKLIIHDFIYTENINKSVRQTRNSNKSILLTLFTLILNFTLCFGEVNISDRFTHCRSSISSPIFGIDDCKIEERNKNISLVEATILEKMNYQIFGDGYSCKMIKIELLYTFHWYFAKSTLQKETVIELFRAECAYMVKSKMCKDQEMKCESGGCLLEYKFSPYFIYGRSIDFVGYSCRIDKITVFSNDFSKKIFNDATSTCLARDLVCKTNEITIIWNEDIIHECPYSVVKQMNLNVSGEIWYSDREKLVFQSTRKIKECDSIFYETTEGFFIVKDKLNSKLTITNKQLGTLKHLMLSDVDYKELISIKRSESLNLKINENTCKTIRMILEVYEKQHNKFISVNDIHGNNFTLYNNDGLIVVADCNELLVVTSIID